VTPPRFVPPQLATLVDRMPIGAGWTFEVKYDGYRLEAIAKGSEVSLLTRRGNDWTARFPAIAGWLGTLKVKDAVLDGEVVVLDAAGRSVFSLLQQSLEGEHHASPTYFAFDLLHLDGRDLKALSLAERRVRLARLLRRLRGAARTGIRLGQRLPGEGAPLLEAACRLGLEGVVAKRLDAPHASGRGRDWVKVKCGRRQEFAVIGFTPPRGSRAGIRSLLLGVYQRNTLRYAGRVGSGFDTDTLRSLKARLQRITRREPPLRPPPAGLPRGTVWVRPQLVVEVADPRRPAASPRVPGSARRQAGP